MKQLGEKLRAIRETLHLNQSTIAQRIGRQQRDISDLEQGKRKAVPTEYIHFLLREGLDMNWLFSEDPLQHPDPYLLQYQKHRETGEVPVPSGHAPRTRLVPRHMLDEYPARHKESNYQRQLPTVSLPGPDLAGHPDIIRGFQVVDDSMSDTLAPYDWVIARKNSTPLEQLAPGYIYIVVTQYQVLVGRLAAHRNGFEGIRLVFDQQAYAPIQIPTGEIREVWRGVAKLSASLTGSKQTLFRTLDEISSSLEEIKDRLPN